MLMMYYNSVQSYKSREIKKYKFKEVFDYLDIIVYKYHKTYVHPWSNIFLIRERFKVAFSYNNLFKIPVCSNSWLKINPNDYLSLIINYYYTIIVVLNVFLILKMSVHYNL